MATLENKRFRKYVDLRRVRGAWMHELRLGNLEWAVDVTGGAVLFAGVLPNIVSVLNRPDVVTNEAMVAVGIATGCWAVGVVLLYENLLYWTNY